MSETNEEEEPIEHRLLKVVDREILIGDDWVVMQHTQTPPRRLPPIVRSTPTTTTTKITPTTTTPRQLQLQPIQTSPKTTNITGRSKKRRKRMTDQSPTPNIPKEEQSQPKEKEPIHEEQQTLPVTTMQQQVEQKEQPNSMEGIVQQKSSTNVNNEDILRESRAPRFVDFTVSLKLAKDHLKAWRDSLWLAPSDLSNALETATIESCFIPFHLFSGVALLADGKGQREFVDMRPNLPCCDDISGINQTDVIITRESISEIEPWNVKTAQTPSVIKASKTELGLLAGGLKSIKLIEPTPVLKIWESSMSDELRKIITGIDGKINAFEDVTYRIVYVPMFCFRYTYSENKYIFLVNGQTGTTWGQKPLGFGGIARVITKFLTGNTVVATSSVLLLSGIDLNSRDKTTIYATDHSFIILPPSDQFLMATAIGWCEIINNGELPIVLQGQWRGSTKRGIVKTFLPKEILRFGFKGSWCIEIISGDPTSMNFIHCETSNGSDKGNSLGLIENNE